MLEKFNKLIEFKVKDNRLEIIFKSDNYTYSMNAEEANELVGELYEIIESLDEYDPEKDPKLIYQKALRNQIIIDIRNDDSQIVKKLLRQVNKDIKLSNLISSNKDGFAL